MDEVITLQLQALQLSVRTQLVLGGVQGQGDSGAAVGVWT